MSNCAIRSFLQSEWTCHNVDLVMFVAIVVSCVTQLVKYQYLNCVILILLILKTEFRDNIKLHFFCHQMLTYWSQVMIFNYNLSI